MSLLGLTIERAARLNPKRILIITLASQAEAAAAELEAFAGRGPAGLPELLLIPEPAARNTAPAIAAGVAAVTSLGSASETALVLPADHLITPLSTFTDDVATAALLAKEGHIVTFGIVPTRPDTGYGYIEAGDALPAHAAGHRVSRFREKPDQKDAEEFLAAGNFTWNSGMFLFTLSIFTSELAEHAPRTAHLYRALSALGVKPTGSVVKYLFDDQAVALVYEKTPKISIDYAVMEKTRRAAVLKAAFEWNDVGSWEEYARLFRAESPATAEIDGRGNYVLSDLPVALVGVEDLIVVVKNGRLLISRRGVSQGVKEALDELPERYR